MNNYNNLASQTLNYFIFPDPHDKFSSKPRELFVISGMPNISQILIVWLLCLQWIYADQYIVRLRGTKSFRKLLRSLQQQNTKFGWVEKIDKRFTFGSFDGFMVDLPNELVVKLERNPLVAEIVAEHKINAFATTGSEELFDSSGILGRRRDRHDENDFSHEGEEDGTNDIYDNSDCWVKTEFEAPRHLARLSRKDSIGTDERDLEYHYLSCGQGEDVTAYVLDTGLFVENPEFESRAVHGIDVTGEGFGDFNGHGTHVAGVIGSKTYGVAKKVSIVDVKVLDRQGSGGLSGVLSGIEYVVNDCKARYRDAPSGRTPKCVANLSLGTFRSTVINRAVTAALEEGVVFVVAAGNGNTNACWNSPASTREAVTVGAFDDRTDTIARFSNWGPCVDVFASGVQVESLTNHLSIKTPMPSHAKRATTAEPDRPFSHKVPSVAYSGTSMASPSVAGLAAVLLSRGIPTANIKDKIITLSTADVFDRRTLVFKPGTPNRILYNGL